MTETIGMLSFLTGFVMDSVSLILWIRRLKGDGPSGIPLIPMIFYIIATFLLDFEWSFGNRAIFLFCCALFHILCQYVIVLIVAKLMGFHNDSREK